MINPFTPARSRQAFTLTELLVVIGIIGILAALLMPLLGSMRERSNQTKCISNIRQLGVGIRLYAAEHRNEVPAYSVTAVPDDTGTPNATYWHQRVQGYVESKFGTTVTKPFICPSDATPYASAISYGLNYNLSGKRFVTIQTNPILLTEVSSITLKGDAADIKNLKYNHANGKSINVLFVDGSVQSMASVPGSATKPSLWIP